ncbi:MAG: hypothetical protein K0V04_45325 [Deltaproteobacteria bacterium]|nr:hypothetical protein [Deltaproteobacteria bacterium]
MRSDMAKVLCERPRCGARFKRRSLYRGPLEDAPRFESSSRNRGGSKFLNEHLGPLRRWLLSQVGRPWDAVYSELRSRVSPRNAVQLHIWQHAQEYVARPVRREDGVLHRQSTWGGFEVLSSRRCPVYVCPKTGILRKTPVTPRKRKSKERAKARAEAEAEANRGEPT